MGEPSVKPIPEALIAEWWPSVLPWAEEFCLHSQGSFNPQFIYDHLREGLMQLWLVMEEEKTAAVCLTEIRRTVLKECIIVVMTGEEMRHWVHLVEVLENYARMMGCDKIIGMARPGWERVMKPYGYEKRHVQLEKFL